MKQAKNSKQISTIPKGVWESSRKTSPKNEIKHTNEISTDLQGNGYPIDKQSK